MSSRRALLYGAAVALIGVSIVAALSWSGTNDVPRTTASGTGRRAPDFRLENVRDPDAVVALADYAGRPVVLNFWASWCVPCRNEMPILERAHQRYGPEVAFVGVDHLDARGAAADFLDETGVTYRSGYDPDGKIAPRYGARGLPETFFISPRGQIVDRIIGELTKDDLDAAITRNFRIVAERVRD